MLGSFIFGLSTDRAETFDATAALAKMAKLTFAQFVLQLLGNALLILSILALMLREDWRLGLGLALPPQLAAGWLREALLRPIH